MIFCSERGRSRDLDEKESFEAKSMWKRGNLRGNKIVQRSTQTKRGSCRAYTVMEGLTQSLRSHREAHVAIV